MKPKVDYHDSPVAWFVEMQLHAEKGNFEQAARAKKELERLGVFVRFKGQIQRKLKKAETALKSKRRATIL
jgi:hypothetical protein